MLEKRNTGKLGGMSRSDIQTNIRLPAELKARLEAASRSSGRTLTTEIIRRLEDSFRVPDPVDELRRRVEELEKTFSRRIKP